MSSLRRSSVLTALLFVGFIPIAAVSGRAAPDNSQSAPVVIQDGEHCVLLLSPGPKWDRKLSRDQQPGMAEHRRYMASLLDKGTMLIGGPFLDEVGGLAVLKTTTMSEAHRIAEADPGSRTGIMHYEFRRWRMSVAKAAPASPH